MEETGISCSICVLALCAAVSAFLLAGCSGASSSISDTIDNITVPEKDGGTVALSDFCNGHQSTGNPKALLVTFSALSGPESQAAADGLQQIYVDNISSDDGLEIVTILVRGAPSESLPTFYVIDPATMKIIDRLERWVDEQTIRDAVAPVIAGN